MNNSTSEVVVKKTIAKAKPVKSKIVAEQFAMAAN
jgi:hypothetical protein